MNRVSTFLLAVVVSCMVWLNMGTPLTPSVNAHAETIAAISQHQFVASTSYQRVNVKKGALEKPAIGSWPNYWRRGYYLANGWLCYGFALGSFHEWHCTPNWHYRNGIAISNVPSWVPLPGGKVTPTFYCESLGRKPGCTSASPLVTVVTHPKPTVKVSSAHAPAPTGGSVAALIQSVFGSYAWAATHVATCESSLNPNAVNRASGASGVFQFMFATWLGTPYAAYSRFNAWANVHAAWWLFTRDGHSWREWTCQP